MSRPSHKKNKKTKIVSPPSTPLRPEGVQPVFSAGVSEKILPGVVLFLFAISLYANTLGHSYALDDVAVIQENRFVKQGFSGIPTLLKTFYWQGYWDSNAGLYRPLSLIMFAAEWALFPNQPFAGHLVNILLYAGSAFLLFITLRKLFKTKNILLPFAASLLFIAHPTHTEVVANIKSRDEILCFLFLLHCVFYAVRYIEKKDTASLALCIAGYPLALLSKESALTFLVLIPLTLWFFTGAIRREYLKIFSLMSIVTVVYFAIRYAVLGAITTPKQYTYLDNTLMATGDFVQQKATAIYMMGRYLWLLVFPHPLSYDYSFREIPVVGFTSPEAIFSFLLYVSMIVYAATHFRKKNIFSFCILFFLISIAMVSNVFILIGATMADRFLYTPSLGFCVAVPYILYRLFQKKEQPNAGMSTLLKKHTLFTGCIATLFVLYSFKTITRNNDWKSNATLFTKDVTAAPNSSRTHYNYGTHLLGKFDRKEKDPDKKNNILDEAIRELETAVRLDSVSPSSALSLANSYLNLGMACYHRGDFKKSIDASRQAIRFNPGEPKAYNNLGDAYFRNNQFDSAIVYLNKSIAMKYESEETWNFLATAYVSKGEIEEGIKCYKKSIALKPSYDEAYNNLGSAYGMLKDYPNALNSFLKSAELNPSNAETYYFIGLTYGFMGDTVNARKYTELSKEKGKK